MQVLLEIELARPFAKSLDLLLQMTTLWSCKLIKINPSKPFNTISMPLVKYRQIWGGNPARGFVEVPNGTEDFIRSVKVIKVKSS